MRDEAGSVSLGVGRHGRPLRLRVSLFGVSMLLFWCASSGVLVAVGAVNVGKGEGGRGCFE